MPLFADTLINFNEQLAGIDQKEIPALRKVELFIKNI